MMCFVCGDDGRVIDNVTGKWVPCPKCRGIVEKAREMNIAELKGVEPDIYADLKIPKIYRDIKYDKETAIFAYASRFIQTDLQVLAERCDKIRDDLLDYGQLPMNSIYIHAPHLIDINSWVYTLQRIAFEKHISTMPYITVNELSKEITDNGFTQLYEEYTNTSLCILSISPKTTQTAAYALTDLLWCRAQKGLPTICTGIWAAEDVIRSDSNVRYCLTQDVLSLNLLYGNNVHYKRQKNNNNTSYENVSPRTTQEPNYDELVNIANKI